VTVHIAIGNSDDGLSQREWAKYIDEVDDLVKVVAEVVHGRWYSAPDVPWQNACWAFEMGTGNFADPAGWIKERLARVAEMYGQDSIAWNESETEFLGPNIPLKRPPLGKVPVFTSHDHTAQEHCHPTCPRWEYVHERGVLQ
jgi:hypothetical protein